MFNHNIRSIDDNCNTRAVVIINFFRNRNPEEPGRVLPRG